VAKDQFEFGPMESPWPQIQEKCCFHCGFFQQFLSWIRAQVWPSEAVRN